MKERRNYLFLGGVVILMVGVIILSVTGLATDSEYGGVAGRKRLVFREESLVNSRGDMIAPSPTPPNEPVGESLGLAEELPASDCYPGQAYTSRSLRYQVCYNPDWSVIEGALSNEVDKVTFQGDLSNKAWPSIIIRPAPEDFQTASYDDLRQRLGEKWQPVAELGETVLGSGQEIVAVEVVFAGAERVPSVTDYYFLHQGRVIEITMNAFQTPGAAKIYEDFLDQLMVY